MRLRKSALDITVKLHVSFTVNNYRNMIGILIISHGNLGDSLIHCANHVMGDKSPHLTDLSITVQ